MKTQFADRISAEGNEKNVLIKIDNKAVFMVAKVSNYARILTFDFAFDFKDWPIFMVCFDMAVQISEAIQKHGRANTAMEGLNFKATQ